MHHLSYLLVLLMSLAACGGVTRSQSGDDAGGAGSASSSGAGANQASDDAGGPTAIVGNAPCTGPQPSVCPGSGFVDCICENGQWTDCYGQCNEGPTPDASSGDEDAAADGGGAFDAAGE
jgi:hypothetical protein